MMHSVLTKQAFPPVSFKQSDIAWDKKKEANITLNTETYFNTTDPTVTQKLL